MVSASASASKSRGIAFRRYFWKTEEMSAEAASISPPSGDVINHRSSASGFLIYPKCEDLGSLAIGCDMWKRSSSMALPSIAMTISMQVDSEASG